MSARETGSLTLAAVRKLALALPGVEESTSYGTPAFKVRGKLLARLNPDEDAWVLHCDPEERELLIRAKSRLCFETDHYRGTSWLLVRCRGRAKGLIGELLEAAWRRRAPRKLVDEYDAGA